MNGIDDKLDQYRKDVFVENQQENKQYEEKYHKIIFTKTAKQNCSPLQVLSSRFTQQSYGVTVHDPMIQYLEDIRKPENKSKLDKYYQPQDTVYQEIKRKQFQLVSNNQPRKCIFSSTQGEHDLHHSYMMKNSVAEFSVQEYKSKQFQRKTFDYTHFRYKPDQFMPTQTNVSAMQKILKQSK